MNTRVLSSRQPQPFPESLPHPPPHGLGRTFPAPSTIRGSGAVFLFLAPVSSVVSLTLWPQMPAMEIRVRPWYWVQDRCSVNVSSLWASPQILKNRGGSMIWKTSESEDLVPALALSQVAV